mgnify:CR=1 FL=1
MQEEKEEFEKKVPSGEAEAEDEEIARSPQELQEAKAAGRNSVG